MGKLSCRFLYPRELRCNFLSQGTKKSIFQILQLLFRTENPVLQLFKFRCDITFSLSKSLPPNKIVRNFSLVGFGNLEAIAEDAVILDF